MLRRKLPAPRGVRVATGALVGWVALSGSCASLPELASNVCGNHVIEPGEDCDGAPIGASTCSSTCRLECASGPEPCPAGWGCGDDGLCRQPTGKFDTLGGGLPIGADQLTLADFDGDGRRDVLATEGSSVSIAYLDQHGLQPQYTTLALAPIDAYVDRPGVGDLYGTGHADLALRVGSDLGVLLGQTDRALLPEVFNRDPDLGLSADEVAYALDVDPQAPGAEIVAVGSTGMRVVRTRGTTPLGPLFTWTSGKTLAGPPTIFTPVSVTQTGERSDIPSIALAFTGDDHITVFPTLVPVTTMNDGGATTTFKWNDTSGTQTTTVITLPSGATVSGPVFAFPMSEYNGDLAIAGTVGGVPQTFLTFYGPAANASGNQTFGYRGGTTPSCTCESCDTCYPIGSSPPTCCNTECCAVSTFNWLAECCGGNAGSPANTATPLELVPVSDAGAGAAVGAPLFSGTISGVTGNVIASASGLYVTSCAASELVECIAPASSGSGFTLEVQQLSEPSGGAPWTTVTPFSRGLLAATAAAGLTYFVEESGVFNPFQIPTQSAVKNLTTGDFNGDGAPDVLFTQVSARATPANPTLQSLQVAFADPFSIPGAPVDLGDIGEASWVLSEADLANGTGISNAIVKLTSGKTPYDVFAGSTDGQLQSPFALLGSGPGASAACNGAPVGVARYSAIGHFSDAAASDVATLYRVGSGAPYSYEIHSIRPTAGVTDSATLCEASLAPSTLSTSGEDAFALLPVDLTGTGTDSLVILPIGGSTLYIGAVKGGAWTVSTVDLGGPFVGMTAASIGTGPAAAQALSDVVLWSTTSVTVLWNDGTGALGTANAATVPLPAGTCPQAGSVTPSTSPNGVAAMTLRGAQKSLVVVTATDTFVASLSSAANRTFAAPTCATTTFGGGGQAIASGDVNGDGVDDFVVARPGGLQVFVGIPVLQ